MFEEKMERYVRTEYGYILENTAKGNGDIVKKLADADKHYEFEYGKIAKSSNRLVDIIEVGDFVNNGYIHEVGSADNGERWVHNLNGLLLYKEDIKTILTKEQYMQNCYTVKRS